ncbi:hypothetical protein, partial [Aureimonas sp. SK2]|uniref:hypothetical protein n=1 Tax=Aureimonas sp. SK2 TaxID=3015992 RepID=UPI002443DF82
LRAFSEVMQHVPIARAKDHQKDAIDLLVGVLTMKTNPALEQLVNGLVYELYFPQDLHARGLTLFEAAGQAGLGRLSTLEGDALTEAAEAFTKAHLPPGQPLRIMLSDLQTLDVVRIIEGRS